MRRTIAVTAVLWSFAAAASAAAPTPIPTALCCTPNGSVEAIAVSGTTAYIGGYFRHVGPVTGSFATVDEATGLLGARWPQVEGQVAAIVADGSGGWYLAGGFTAVGGVARDGLAHLLADRTLDLAWKPGTNGYANVLAVFGDNVYIGGQFTEVTDGATSTARTNLAAFNRTSGAVSAVGAGGGANGSVVAFAVRPGGNSAFDAPPRLYVGGSFTTIDTQARGRIASYTLDGNLTSTFAGTGFNDEVTALLTVNVGTRAAPNWRLHAGGRFGLFGPVDLRTRLAAFDDNDVITAWAPSVPTIPGNGPSIYNLAAGGSKIYVATSVGLRAFERDGAGAAFDWSPDFGTFGIPYSLLVSGDTVYVGGSFFNVNGNARRTNAAAFDAIDDTVVRPWDPEPGGSGISAIAAAADGAVAIAGDFVAAGGTPRNHLAAFDLESGELTTFDPGADREVTTLAVGGGRLYAAGGFATVNGSTARSRMAAFDLASGTATAFDPNVDGSIAAIGVAPDAVFIAGGFSAVNGGVPRNNIAALDPVTGTARSFAPAFDYSVNTLAIRDAKVYMGGSFLTMAGEDRKHLAAVQEVPGTVGALTPFDPDPDGSVFGIVLDGDRVYAGGQFDNAGTPPKPSSRVAAFDAASGSLVPWDASIGGLVLGLAKAGDKIVAGGSFTTANGQPRSNLAAFGTGDGGLSPWAPQLDGPVNDVTASSAAGLVVGGSFRKIDGKVTGPLAAFALPPEAPAAPAAAAGSGLAVVNVPPPPSGGAPITSYSVTASPGGQTVVSTGPSVTVAGLTNGTSYAFTATATNRVGSSPPSPSSSPVTPAATPPPPGPGTGTSRDRQRPIIRGIGMTNLSFRLGARRTPKVARAKAGTTFRFSISEPAQLAITIARSLPGRRSGKACVRPRRALKRVCTRYVRVHTLSRRTATGAGRVNYSGRVGRTKLTPGSYRAALVATDAAGNRSAAAYMRFRVVRR